MSHVEFWKEQMSKIECGNNWVVFENGTMVHPSEDGKKSAMDIMRKIDDLLATNAELIKEYQCFIINGENAVVRFNIDYRNISVRCPYEEVEAEMMKYDKSNHHDNEFFAQILCVVALNKLNEDARNRVVLYENTAGNKHAEPEKNESAAKVDAFLALLSTAVH
ncbi:MULTISPECIES: hypothetical protein [Nitrosomonas]|uniref:Uncharacterized protein n=2 Tax=Nitrosomonas communis TaxID=44574 RepID=A0A0F7KFY8_9PROT|nr:MULTISPECIES: hypothetical protein [Nitrosomonas]AKH38336.1 hypothetical protein AAW31_11890 [Nitrosomonas communis]TYP90071.1 hypothetical protein BCL69_10158 [Nitrosomonas communis]UVS60336.1 hypothetical protein NX761_12555 [Nitrosomonas sp. PLL12]